MTEFGAHLQTETKSTYSLLGLRNRHYKIPEYQRPYLWEPKLVWKLLSDIWDAHANDLEFKFIGTVITHAADASGHCHEICDGQQRTVTILLIVRAILFWCSRHEKDKLGQRLRKLEPNLFDADGSQGEDVPKLRLFNRDLNNWFFNTFVKADQDEELARNIDKIQRSEQQSIIMNSFRTALSFLASKFGSAASADLYVTAAESNPQGLPSMYLREQLDKNLNTLENMTAIDKFASFLLYKCAISHSTVKNPRAAIDIFNSLNGTGVPLTETQQVMALLLTSQDADHTKHAEDWQHAEEVLNTVSWGDAAGLKDTALQEELERELLKRYLRCLREAQTSGRDTEVKTLKDYFLDSFQVQGMNTHKEQTCKLFNKGQPNEEAIEVFFEQFFSKANQRVCLFTSLMDLQDTSWVDDTFAVLCDGDIKVKVQNCITLLQHIGHMGLDQNWVHPAFLFVHRHVLPPCSEACSNEEVLDFFQKLERLSAYMFLCPAHCEDERQRERPRHPKLGDKILGDKSFRYDHCRSIQRVWYKALMERMKMGPLGAVLQWMGLSTPEAKNVLHSIEETYDTRADWSDRKIATYLLLKAESTLQSDCQKLHLTLTQALPQGLRVQDVRCILMQGCRCHCLADEIIVCFPN
jgi:hypothetical protein